MTDEWLILVIVDLCYEENLICFDGELHGYNESDNICAFIWLQRVGILKLTSPCSLNRWK